MFLCVIAGKKLEEKKMKIPAKVEKFKILHNKRLFVQKARMQMDPGM
jgi:hypothetical protein